MDRRETIEKALKSAKALPAGPMVMAKISELCQDPRASARDLGKVLQLDTALTNRVLKQVNSSFYGLAATIKTVTHAVVILGFQEIKHVALSVPVANLFQEHFDKPGIDIQDLWENSLSSACMARALSYHIKHPVPEQVFVSGILADTGMVILNNILGNEYAAVVAGCPDDAFLPEMEEKELGISHIEVGRKLTKKWHFPDDLIQAIGAHHDPIVDGRILTEPALVYLGRRFMPPLMQGQPPEALLEDIPNELIEEFKLTPEATNTAFEKAGADLEAAKQMLQAG